VSEGDDYDYRPVPAPVLVTRSLIFVIDSGKAAFDQRCKVRRVGCLFLSLLGLAGSRFVLPFFTFCIFPNAHHGV
jgi:hypothetical protein